MNESNFVTIINNSINYAGGFAYKIPDMPFIPNNPVRFTGKKPFDSIAVLDGNSWFIEVKYNKGICGFSEKIFKPHQLENLLKIYANCHDNIYPVMMYGCYVPRKVKRIYVFHMHLFKSWILKISKKELMGFPFMAVKKVEYEKLNKKTGEKKLVREDLFDARNMEKCIIR